MDASDAPLDVPVVLTLYSSSFCGACAQTRRAIEDAAGLLGDRVTVREVNVADDPEESERRDIVATPTTVLTAPDGTELARAAGVPSAPQVLTLLAKHLEPGARSQEVSTPAGRIGPFVPAEADGSC